jgi:hypothetical protein
MTARKSWKHRQKNKEKGVKPGSMKVLANQIPGRRTEAYPGLLEIDQNDYINNDDSDSEPGLI